MRRIALLVCAAVVVGCAKKADESDVPADTTVVAPAPAAPAGIALADVSGTWNVKVMPEGKDTVLTTYQLWASADTTAWKMKFDNRPDTIQVHVWSVAGDSIVTHVGPYKSALRKNAMVTTHSVIRIQDGKLAGKSVAHYAVSTPDSVVNVRTEGTRAQ